MEQKLIDEINHELSVLNLSWYQGIFIQPQNIPYKIRELVIYSRSSRDEFKNHFKVLDLVIMKVCPNISYSNYRKILKLIETTGDKEYEYYGDSSEYFISYIVLSKFEKLVKEFN